MSLIGPTLLIERKVVSMPQIIQKSDGSYWLRGDPGRCTVSRSEFRAQEQPCCAIPSLFDQFTIKDMSGFIHSYIILVDAKPDTYLVSKATKGTGSSAGYFKEEIFTANAKVVEKILAKKILKVIPIEALEGSEISSDPEGPPDACQVCRATDFESLIWHAEVPAWACETCEVNLPQGSCIDCGNHSDSRVNGRCEACDYYYCG
jgi:hypothetical protein